MAKLTAKQRRTHSIPKDVTLLVTPENFDRIAEFQEVIEDVPEEVFRVEFAVAKYKGKTKFMTRDFRLQSSVEAFTRLVEMAGGEVKGIERLEDVRG